MNNTPRPNRRPPGNGRPPQRNSPSGPDPRRAQNPGQNPPPPNRQMPPQNGGYSGRPQQPYGAPPGYGQPDPEVLRRKREYERRQAEAQRQRMRDRERREKMRRKAERDRRRKQNLKILGGRLLVFAVILLILCALTGIVFLISLHYAPDKPDTTGSMTYFYGGSETRKIPVEDAVSDDVIYICFNDLAAYLGMMESGTAESMRFILPMSEETPPTSGGTGTEESITFRVNEINVEINGQSAQLNLPNILRGTEVWVSSAIITDYMTNLSFEYNSRKSDILISRILDEENSNEEDKIFVYLPVSFKLKNSDALPPLSEEEVLGAQD